MSDELQADILGNMPMSIRRRFESVQTQSLSQRHSRGFPVLSRIDIIQNSYSEWLRTLERPFHEEDRFLAREHHVLHVVASASPARSPTPWLLELIALALWPIVAKRRGKPPYKGGTTLWHLARIISLRSMQVAFRHAELQGLLVSIQDGRELYHNVRTWHSG